jgi:probable metal-binding protein
MNNPIHGHEVMQMMVESGGAFSRTSLESAIVARFGAETRFFTCSVENMTAAELIEFLAQRGKFIEREGGFSTAPEKICNH